MTEPFDALFKGSVFLNLKGETYTMLKKTITYADYNGESRTETFFFNLNKAELTEMEMSCDGGFVQMIEKIVEEKSAPRIIEIFKDLILKAYGEKSPDGKRFVKNQELRDNFSQTEAYSELFMELVMNADAASAFVNGIIPTAQPISSIPAPSK